MLVAFSVAPSTSDTPDASVHDAVAKAIAVVRASGLPHETNAMFTLVEGEWEEVMDVVHQACLAIGEVSPRVSLVLKADIRPGYQHQMREKVQRIDDILGPDQSE